MVKKVLLHCPCCGQNALLFLCSDPYMIILDCPACKRPIMYIDGEFFPLNSKDAKSVKKNLNRASRMNKARPEMENEPSLYPLVPNRPGRYCSGAMQHTCEPMHGGGARADRKPISSDDILNLRIALETCKDTGEFIAHM